MNASRHTRTLPMLGALVAVSLLCGCDRPVRAPEPEVPPDPRPLTPEAPGRRVVVLGDSLTAGHTLPREEAYPAHLQQFIEAEGWPFTVVNAGVNGETSTDGLQRTRWILSQPTEVLLLELGGNDGLRGIPVNVTRKNLQEIVRRAQEMHPGLLIVLAGMKLPPNYGPEYVAAFERIYPDLAEQNRLPLIPFLLEGVAAVPELNLPDGIHPTAEGHRKVADVVWQTLRPLLADRAALDP